MQRDLDADWCVAFLSWDHSVARNEDWWAVKRCAAAVQVLDERGDSSLVTEIVALASTLVDDLDPQAGVQEGEFSQSLRENVERELGRRKDLGIGVKGDARSGVVGNADFFEGALGDATLVCLAPHLSVAFDL